jgi:hypothetical protein
MIVGGHPWPRRPSTATNVDRKRQHERVRIEEHGAGRPSDRLNRGAPKHRGSEKRFSLAQDTAFAIPQVSIGDLTRVRRDRGP